MSSYTDEFCSSAVKTNLRDEGDQIPGTPCDGSSTLFAESDVKSTGSSNQFDDEGPPSNATGGNGENATEVTRELVKKFIGDIWSRGELDLIPDVVSPSLRFNCNNGFDRVGHEGLARMVAAIRDALDDYHCEIHSMVVDGNKAFCRLRFSGKHTGPLLGFKPTNRVVAWMGATEFTVLRGKILKVWELGDVKSLEEQLGGKPLEEGKSRR